MEREKGKGAERRGEIKDDISHFQNNLGSKNALIEKHILTAILNTRNTLSMHTLHFGKLFCISFVFFSVVE